MYDQLGQISPLVLIGKINFQEVVRRGLDLDYLVPDDLTGKWQV